MVATSIQALRGGHMCRSCNPLKSNFLTAMELREVFMVVLKDFCWIRALYFIVSLSILLMLTACTASKQVKATSLNDIDILETDVWVLGQIL